jgi:hypothetical protein
MRINTSFWLSGVETFGSPELTLIEDAGGGTSATRKHNLFCMHGVKQPKYENKVIVKGKENGAGNSFPYKPITILQKLSF